MQRINIISATGDKIMNSENGNTAANPTLTFTAENLAALFTAQKALQDLEKLISLISEVDPENKILLDLRRINDLLRDLSPLYAGNNGLDPIPTDLPMQPVPFTLKNMIDLLIAYDAYRSLIEVLELFMGSYPTNDFAIGLSYLGEILRDISPVFDPGLDDDENIEFCGIINSIDLSLPEKARRLMGDPKQEYRC